MKKDSHNNTTKSKMFLMPFEVLNKKEIMPLNFKKNLIMIF